MKKLVRLTESDLHKIIKESVKRILREENHYYSDYTNLPLKDGGWDSHAYRYDDALENAESLEDWDERMRRRKSIDDTSANVSQTNHPQYNEEPFGGKSIGASIYVNPETHGLKKDEVDDYLTQRADRGRRNYGFPI